MQQQNPVEVFLEAQRQTSILRQRKNLLYTFGATRLPYVFLGESAINQGDIVVRSGEVSVKRPQIIAPGQDVELEGFGFEELEGEGAEAMIPVLLNRWVQFPPAKYANTHGTMEVVPGPLERAVENSVNRLDQKHDIRTAVITGNEAMWGFSVLGYVGQMIAKSAPSNIGEYFERFGHPNT
ncbi:MAG: hypothetical protein ACYTGH_18795 [Planctomycetota bacterium]|jgi:hypothetical protein